MAIVVSLLTLLSMIKVWTALVRRSDEDDQDGSGGGTGVLAPTVPRVGIRLTLPALVLAAVTLGLGLGAELLYGLSATAAAGLLETDTYVEAVLTS
ncbi:hypothetical protein [Pseudonocardia sp. ICBG162]|uniref:hypothetical protein n=1 Tax=Pseudonocardia sp. ICBG162 TaxID=2846761 RepID=UPI001CF6CB72|nr:hypothetical protein [Pseudonocardia sp. ICBG162]